MTGRRSHSYARDPEVVGYELWGPNTEAETRVFVESAIRSRREAPRLAYELEVTLRGTGELIGGAGIRIRDMTHREGDIGYVIRPSLWRQGLGTQVGRGLVQFGFNRLRLHRIGATCHIENIASASVLKRAGMMQEGTLRSHKFRRGVWADSLLFAVLETDERPGG